MDKFRMQIDAGLVEDTGPCEHGAPFDGEGCPWCAIGRLERQVKDLEESLEQEIALRDQWEDEATNLAIAVGQYFELLSVAKTFKNGAKTMKSAEAILIWSLDVECPYCGADVDLADQDDDAYFSKPIFNNDWDAIVGMEAHCPDCSADFTISNVEC